MSEGAVSAEFEALLEYLKHSRGFDFTGYKRASLQRRIDRRIEAIGVPTYATYVEFLELHPDEFTALFDAILINVTSFFRDPAAWNTLRAEVMPSLLDRLGPDAPIRAWSAGCASGEEAYSLAILLAELLGVEQFSRRVKIYGTDVDEDALNAARQATYEARQVAAVPEELRSRYFDSVGSRFTFRNDLRRSVVFGRLDVIHNAPISHLEILLCRNTLMYFNAETQAQVIQRFHFGLHEGGVLMLGKAETLLTRSLLFQPIDRKQRIFARSAAHTRSERPAERVAYGGPAIEETAARFGQHSEAFRTAPIAALLFDPQSTLLDMNDRARALLGLSEADLGRPLQDLDVSYRPVDLRTPVDQALATRVPKLALNVDLMLDGVSRVFDVEVVPHFDRTASAGIGLYFHDRTELRDLEERVQLTTLELEQAYQAVQSTNEELETTNEELQSTIEELETTNEELQSTNEELETMNEELQSTNDELQTVNEELRARSHEVGQLNAYMAAILGAFRGGVAVVDAACSVLMWNPQAAELWGVREDEVVGKDLLSLDIGLPLDEVAPLLKRVLVGESAFESLSVAAVTRRGRSVVCVVALTNLDLGLGSRGAIVVMSTQHEDEAAPPGENRA